MLVGVEDAELVTSAAGSPGALVEALVPNRKRLEVIRGRIDAAGLCGRVSSVYWNGHALPYADNMVNLLLVPNAATTLTEEEMRRVLAPRGVAWRRRGDSWTSYCKPVQGDTDQWSHARYDATGNAVSRDQRVGPPRFLQWEAKPRWNRGTKTSVLVSTRGRIFYILDDSHFTVRSPSWSLIARDAYNGILLWRHPLAGWPGAPRGKKVGPAQIDRRLVAGEQRVYLAPNESEPVRVLDAATGKLVHSIADSRSAKELILSDGVLIVLIDPNNAAAIRRGQKRRSMWVAVFDADTGKPLWRRSETMILPMTLAANGKRVVYHDGQVVRSIGLHSGKLLCSSPPAGQKIIYRSQANPDRPGAEKGKIILAPQFAPTLILYKDIVALAGGCQVNVFSAGDGHELWRAAYAPSNYSVPADLFGFTGQLWGPDPKMDFWRPMSDDLVFNAYDLHTGAVKQQVKGSYRFRFQHHRCHQMKAAGSTILASRAGVEFVDTRSGKVTAHHWLRGSCYYGIMPANGLLYAPPHNCACYIRAKLHALASVVIPLPCVPIQQRSPYAVVAMHADYATPVGTGGVAHASQGWAATIVRDYHDTFGQGNITSTQRGSNESDIVFPSSSNGGIRTWRAIAVLRVLVYFLKRPGHRHFRGRAGCVGRRYRSADIRLRFASRPASGNESGRGSGIGQLWS